MSEYPYRDAVNKMMDNGFNVRDEYKDLSLEELQKVQREDTIPYAVCIVNVLGDLNVGMMLRSACCFGAERFFVIGRRKFDRRSAVGAQNYMDVVRVNAIDEQIDSNFGLEVNSQKVMDTITDYGYTPLVFETKGQDMREMKWIWPELNRENARPCLIFGNEGYGLPDDLIQMIPLKHRIKIPQWGVLRSLNVSAAASIAMHEAAINVWITSDIPVERPENIWPSDDDCPGG